MSLNGYLPDTLLTWLPWPEASGLRLRADAAASLGRLAAAFEADLGYPLRLTDAYRDYAGQVSLKASKGAFAATPGTSKHGLGIAIDMASRINIETSTEHRWMETNGPQFGWINPWWAVNHDPRDGQHEPWHWEYHAGLDQHTYTAPAVTHTPAPIAQEIDMPLNNSTDPQVISAAVLMLLRQPEVTNIIAGACQAAIVASQQTARDAVLLTLREPEVSNIIATAALRAIDART